MNTVAEQSPAERDESPSEASSTGGLRRRLGLESHAMCVAAGGAVAFQLATSRVWGLSYDEFLFISAARRLDWGYGHPNPFVPYLYRLAGELFGWSQFALRVFPAVLSGFIVVIGVLLAREIGGGRFAQRATAVACALGPIFVSSGHTLGTVSVDIAVWGVAALLVLRLVHSYDTRLWVVIGGVAGIGFLNKPSSLLWVLGALCGLLASRRYRIFLSIWLPVGIAVAAALVAPLMLWQVRNDWPMLQYASAWSGGPGWFGSVLSLMAVQLMLFTPFAALALLPVGSRRGSRLRNDDARLLGWAYAVVVLVLSSSGWFGKSYLVLSVAIPLVAVAAIRLEECAANVRRAIAVAFVVLSLLMAPIVTPVLSPETYFSTGLYKPNSLDNMIGFDRIASQVAAVFHELPIHEQQSAVILANSYGQAGSLQYYGPELGLPDAISGHDAFWWWGPGEARRDAVVVAVGFQSEFLRNYFARCTTAGSLGSGGEPMAKAEIGQPIVVCRGMEASWSDVWPALKRMEG